MALQDLCWARGPGAQQELWRQEEAWAQPATVTPRGDTPHGTQRAQRQHRGPWRPSTHQALGSKMTNNGRQGNYRGPWPTASPPQAGRAPARLLTAQQYRPQPRAGTQAQEAPCSAELEALSLERPHPVCVACTVSPAPGPSAGIYSHSPRCRGAACRIFSSKVGSAVGGGEGEGT